MVVKVKKVGVIDFESKREKNNGNSVIEFCDLESSLMEKKRNEFDGKFPYYNQIVDLILNYNNRNTDNRINSVIDSVVSMGRETYSGFSIEHVLLPYLFEKDNMGILNDKERELYNEIIMFSTGSKDNIESLKSNMSFICFLKECYALNGKLHIDLFIVKDEISLLSFFRSFDSILACVFNAEANEKKNSRLRIVKDKK